MGSVRFYLLVAGLGVLLRTSESKGFTVHLFDEVSSGTVIFNGSLPESGYSYYIEQLDSTLPLSGIAINASSGIVYATSVLRCERTFKFHIKAVRKVYSSFRDIVVVHVTVYVHGQNCFTKYRRKRIANKAETLVYRSKRNVNNNAPKFQQARYSRRVLEEQEPPLLIDTITAVDLSGEGQITYSLLATKDRRSQLMFTIDAVSGQIATTQKLDREAIPVHFLAIIATADRGRSVLTASTQLVITVLDINDHAPLFERTVYVASISESSSIGESIITIRATDDDAESNGLIEYSLQLDDRDEGTFSINSQTGSISIQRSLDREKKDFYRFFVTASDKALIADRQSSTATVEITVIDENDNRPFFEKSSYIVEVNEDLDYTDRPTLVEVKAIDIDSGVNSLIRYSISSGNELGAFAIDADTGSIALVKPLDFERLSSYQLTVRAQDGGSPPRSNTTVVNIRVIDVNDNDPRFFLPLYQASIVENVPVGSNVLQVQAVDADSGFNGAVVYSFQNVVGYFPFVIGRTNGQITTNGTVDREVQSRYFFRVEARDQGKLARSATVPVEITVRDLNDNSPMFEPDAYYAAASEEYPLGTFVTMVTATDIDEAENGQLTYSISSGNVGNAFSIHKQAEQGAITVARKLNYREQNVYALVVAATDHGGLSGFATVFVNISAANIHAPAFQGTPYYVRVNEDLPVGGTVFRVRASDDDVGDNAAVSYSIADGSNTFAINAATGDVTTKLPLDRESKASHVLLVIARDHGLPPKSDTAELEIVLNDVNDNPPVFLQSSYAGRVSEDAFIGTSVAAIAASDVDQGLNGRVFYTFDGESAYSGEGDFLIDAVHGTIRVARPLDRERTARYALVALAVDRGEPVPLTASVTITVDVDDVNDNAPQFDMGVLHLYVKENSPVGTCIGQVTAIDPDGGEGHADVEYSMLEAYDYESFSMVVLPGAPGATVCTQIELDYEGGRKEYVITIRARSLDLFSDASVHIHVQDVNDNVPVLNDFAIVFNNFENHFPTGNIGRVPAFDLDINDTLRYKFVAGNQAHILHLNQTTGLLRLDSRLNSDVPIDATLIVSVSDGINEVRSTCRLYVRLVTRAMLDDSVTVRLGGVEGGGFLSPLYTLFTSAVAAVLRTTPDSVYVIDVSDDSGRRTLNISFSVRAPAATAIGGGQQQGHEMGRQGAGDSRDVFYSASYVRERIYLQHGLLSRLSTLQVLPSDEGLCVREPCVNYERCVSTLRFANASDFVSSASMLFRPIRPVTYFQCQCPLGFTGMMHPQLCDTEVNLCYSSPCLNGATCRSRESGYTCLCPHGYQGDRCEIAYLANGTQCDQAAGYCKSPSVCMAGSSGLRCELCEGGGRCVDCSHLSDRGLSPTCHLRARTFAPHTFILFPALKARHRFDISLSFATVEPNSLLLYNGRYDAGQHDFISLHLVNRQVTFTFSLGADVASVTTSDPWGYNDGTWHRVTMSYYNRVATLIMGDDCDVGLALKLNTSSGSCASRVELRLDDRCADETESCFRFLDLTGPLHLGGLLSSVTSHTAVSHLSQHFTGCLRDVSIDGRIVDLDDYVWNNGTEAGCAIKRPSCASSPCRNGGTCEESWGSYRCSCLERWGGKDCSQAIGIRYSVSGGRVEYVDHGLPTVQLPWYNIMSFRTHQPNVTLLEVQLGESLIDAEEPAMYAVRILLVDGFLTYIHSERNVSVTSMPLHDGRWHNVHVTWSAGKVTVNVDYGLMVAVMPSSDWTVGSSVGGVYVGGSESVSIPFTGCVENIRVGNNAALLMQSPRLVQASPGCVMPNPCHTALCPANSVCVVEFNAAECRCNKGYAGTQCLSVCSCYNPCQNGATCVQQSSSHSGYKCVCPSSYSGTYCEHYVEPKCPSGWYGHPVCGPCNCPVERGFDANCDASGSCRCKPDHYQPPGSDHCYRCDCYEIGSANLTCDPLNGQCHCKLGVVGRRCDACSNRLAEVTRRGCEYLYDSCPRSYAGALWWERTPFGSTAVQRCPLGTVGDATRRCERFGWRDEDLYNCTSDTLIGRQLEKELQLLEQGLLQMTPFLAKSLMRRLNDTVLTSHSLFGRDVNIISRLLVCVLKHENAQSGFNMTHMQDRNFIQNLVNVVGAILEPAYERWWRVINSLSGGSVQLLLLLEQYIATVADNMPHVFMQPLDRVHKNIVFGVDYVSSNSVEDIVRIPKYDNKVQNVHMFDADTSVALSVDAGRRSGSGNNNTLVDFAVNHNQPLVVVGYILFKTLGDLLPSNVDDTVRLRNNVARSVASPVFLLHVSGSGRRVSESDVAAFTFRQVEINNRSSPQCVYWHWDNSTGVQKGAWSRRGCDLVARETRDNGQRLVSCNCSHLSAFAVLMDVSSIEYDDLPVVDVLPIVYVCLALSLLLLTASLLTLCCLRRLRSNSNSIHVHLLATVCASYLVFLIGIDKVYVEVVCRFTAILLHYFLVSSFAWMFVESLHTCRMLIEIRNINHGSMKFYYVIGYVLPGITVGLAVGLDINNYGNSRFCWFALKDTIVWSLVGPVILIILCNIASFACALRLTCTNKSVDKGQSVARHSLWAAIFLLPLLTLSWSLCLLAVNDGASSLQYAFAVCCLLQSIFFVLIHVFFSSKVRKEARRVSRQVRGKEDLDDVHNSSPTKSSLAYRHHSSTQQQATTRHSRAAALLAGVASASTTPTTSSSWYRQRSHASPGKMGVVLPSNGSFSPCLSNGDQRLITASSRQRGVRRSADSESDSELSAMEQSGLASSHSSDADDDTDSGWLVTRSQQEGGNRKNPDVISQPSGHSPNQTSPKQGDPKQVVTSSAISANAQSSSNSLSTSADISDLHVAGGKDSKRTVLPPSDARVQAAGQLEQAEDAVRAFEDDAVSPCSVEISQHACYV